MNETKTRMTLVIVALALLFVLSLVLGIQARDRFPPVPEDKYDRLRYQDQAWELYLEASEESR